jgi:hypothetical protein
MAGLRAWQGVNGPANPSVSSWLVLLATGKKEPRHGGVPGIGLTDEVLLRRW